MKPKTLILSLLCLLVILVGAATLAPKAFAINQPQDTPIIGHNAPTIGSGDIYPNGAQDTPWLAVGVGDYFGPYSYAKVYAPIKQSKVQITINLDACNTDLPHHTSTVGAPRVNFTFVALDKNSGILLPLPPVLTTNSSDCGKSFSRTMSVDANNGLIKTINGQDYVVFQVQAHMVSKACPSTDTNCSKYADGGRCNTASDSQCTDVERSFNISATDPDTGGPGAYETGLSAPNVNLGGCHILAGSQPAACDPTDPTSYFGIYNRDLGVGSSPSCQANGSGCNWDWSVQFSPDCSITTQPGTQAIIYDIDSTTGSGAQAFPQPYLGAVLSSDNRTDVNFNWNTLVSKQKNLPAGQDPFTPGNNQRDTLGFTAQPYQRYRLWLQDVYWSNTIQIFLPFDQFNAADNCTQISCTVTPVDGDPNTVQVIVKNDASYPWGKGYQVREQYDDSASNAVKHLVNGVYYDQKWPSLSSVPSRDGFSTNIQPNDTDTRTSTDSHPNGDSQVYFYKPATSSVKFVLYDDTSTNANVVPWDNNGGTCSIGNTSIIVKCGGITVADVEPGQSSSNLYQVNVKAYGGGTASGYKVELDAQPGAYVDPPNQQTIPDISNPGGNSTNPGYSNNFTFSGYLTYTGTVNAKVLDSDGHDVLPDCPPVTPTPKTRPYFVVKYGDISAGGGFENTDGTCNGSGNTDPPYVSPYSSNYNPPSKSPYSGGIRAFADPGNRGANAAYGVDALGEIYKNTHVGFYSNSDPQALFANLIPASQTDSRGGYLYTNSAAHCVPDFFYNTRSGTPAPIPDGTSVDTLATGQYKTPDSTDVTLHGGDIVPGTRVTIYVDGNVTIDGDIINREVDTDVILGHHLPGGSVFYNWDATNPYNIPFLTIVARGNITLTPNVKRIDGLFIAQPKVSGLNSYSGGQFNTCNGFCPNQLIVNGAVIAQEVHLLHAHGTLGPLQHDDNSIGETPAEIFNFAPAMIMGVPNFNQNQTSTGALEGLFSLPPVF